MHVVRLAAVLTALAVPAAAFAEPWVFQYDEFSSDLATAVSQIDGGQFYTQPGFVAGEAFGQVYKPTADMYPLRVTGFDLVLAAPPNAAAPLYSDATIEIYNSESLTADPGAAPIFTISTADLYNPKTQQFGLQLQGNTAIQVDFGQGAPEDRPPMITSGRVWLVVRFTDPATDMTSEWGLQCAQVSIPELGLETCGCQNVGTVHDNAITGKANVMNIVTPIGSCSGSKTWVFMENAGQLADGFKIDGDVILRLHADVAAAPCEPACDGLECGDDGCGGTCGSCGALTCSEGQCVSCVPSCLSKQCGDNGCGGTCGSCNPGTHCGDDFFCHADCTPDCSGKTCGSNGCGGTCGTCAEGTECSEGACHTVCQPDCQFKDCGSDGCGGTCGTCEGEETCEAGHCTAAACAPDCGGKTCGPDGCGGSCGACGDGETCEAGQCQAPIGAAPIVTNVSPARSFAMTATPVSVVGSGFVAGATVKVGATDCTDVSVTGGALISAKVPALPAGMYSVIVVNPDGGVGTLVDGFQVLPIDVVSTENGSGNGCSGGPETALWAAALGLLLGRARTRRVE